MDQDTDIHSFIQLLHRLSNSRPQRYPSITQTLKFIFFFFFIIIIILNSDI